MGAQPGHPRRSLSPMLIIAAVLLLLLAVTAVVIAGLPSVIAQFGAGQPPTSEERPPTDTPAAEPSSAGATAEPSGPSVEGEEDDRAWWRMRPDLGGANFVIDVGTLELGTTGQFEAPGWQSNPGAVIGQRQVVLGPRDGLAVAIWQDDRQFVVTALDARTGDTWEVLRASELIVDAAFAGGDLVFLTADASAGDPTGLWRTEIAADAEPELLDDLASGGPSVRLAAQALAILNLIVSPDGTAAAVLQCRLQDCLIRTVSLSDGTRNEQRVPFGAEPVAVFDHYVLIVPQCPAPECCTQPPCGPVRLDVATGESEPVPLENWQFFGYAAVQGVDGPLLVAQTQGMWMPGEGVVEEPKFSVVDLQGMTARPPVPVPLAQMRIVADESFDFGIETAPGWFKVAGQELDTDPNDPAPPQHAYEINAETGEVRRLFELVQFAVQG